MKLANTVIAAVAALGVAGAASAAGQTFDIAIDNNSWDGIGSANNDHVLVDLAALGLAEENWILNGVGWDITVTPNGASWYSEPTFLLGGPVANPTQLGISPGAGDDLAGNGNPMSYVSDGIIKLGDAGFDDIAVVSGILDIEIYEGFDDFLDEIDATVSGTLTLQFVPAPGAIALLGLAGLVSRRRRR